MGAPCRQHGPEQTAGDDIFRGMTTHLEATFSLDTWDLIADEPPAIEGPATARVILGKTYPGPMLVATASGHALTTQGPAGASYVAQERIVGTIDGRSGSFVLEHRATGGTALRARWRR